MKKICKKCGRNRRIGKFGKDSKTKDGKRIYCKDCVKEYNLAYINTYDGNIKHKKTVKKWKVENKEAISIYNNKYYRKNRDRIMYNKKAREETESILIPDKEIIENKKENIIVINPKRKKKW